MSAWRRWNAWVAVALALLGSELLCIGTDTRAANSAPTQEAAGTGEALLGEWLSADYLDALARTRAPNSAAAQSAPLAFTVTRVDGALRLTSISFHEAYWRTVVGTTLDATPARIVLGRNEDVPEPASNHVLEAKLERNADERIEFITAPFWSADEPVRYRHLDGDITGTVNDLLTTGRYRDGAGKYWTFERDGTLERPDGATQHYTVSLDPSEACCDYLRVEPALAEGDMIGFARKGDTLELRRIVIDEQKCPIDCPGEPFAVLQMMAKHL